MSEYHIVCRIPSLSYEISQALNDLGFCYSEGSKITLLIDGPWGTALQYLEQNSNEALIVVTDSPCPEYWEDLWQCQPQALLAGGSPISLIGEALRRVDNGETFSALPHYVHHLTASERQLLKLSALGWDNKQIAVELKLAEGTVKNGLNRVFAKLNLSNRTQAALYYWGLWHLLKT